MGRSSDSYHPIRMAYDSIFGTHQTLAKPIVIIQEWSDVLPFMS